MNQKGFTLAESVVTAGLLGVVSLAMLQGLKQDSSTKQLMRLEDEIQGAMKTVNALVKDSVACTTTFKDLSVPKTGTGVEISSLKNAGGATATFRVGSTGTAVALAKGTIITGAGATAAESNLVLSDMRLQNFKEFFRVSEDMGNSAATAEVTYGIAEFVLSFTRKTGGGESQRTATIKRSINLTFKTIANGGRTAFEVESCANQSDITALQLKKRVCAQMVQVSGGSVIMVGSYSAERGECLGIVESLQEVSTDLLCKELGGYLLLDSAEPGKYKCAVIPEGMPSCMNGFRKFGGDGRPECITP